jgi:predicted DsbA family dithiol-disulfide isomerase
MCKWLNTPPPALEIEVYFDFVCPWCFIGARHLRSALNRLAELRPDARPRVTWRSHQLLPDTPLDGVPYQAFYLRRLGGSDAVAARKAQVRNAGKAAGIDFAFERINVLPNTAAAHELVAYAADHGTPAQHEKLIERMFTAFFIEGIDIGDLSILERLALDCGLSRDGWRARLADSHGRRDQLMAPPQLPYRVDGVPFFVLNGSHVLSGAASADLLLKAMLA